ncbi:ABC transporter ATP-binding protein [Plantibacter sp. Mn2098]|uniref:ABC transporter ATP-binding protein n=1 Tax=Plantibacter sp. Mn2098 TaxID=3395266 RepID=UPI003BE5CCEF
MERATTTASTRTVTVDGTHPARTLLHLLGRYKGKLIPAVLVFAVKDSPLWLMPILTSAIIDVVVAGGPLGKLWLYASIAVVVLVQNYPSHVLWTRLYSGSTRHLGADLRNSLAARLQSLSIGFHSRASASIIQTKVVRDVENVELMLQQAGAPALSAVFVLIGAITTTAILVPQFIVVFALTVPIAVGLFAMVRLRANRRNELFRLEVEQFSARVGEMATLMPITRAHGLEGVAQSRVANAAEGVRSAGFTLDMLNGRFGSATWVVMQVLAFGTLIVAAVFSLTGFIPITAGEVVLVSTYFTILTGGITSLLMLVPIMSKGMESIKSIGEVMQEPDLEHNAGKRRVDRVNGAVELRDVGYRFERGAPPALDGIDLAIAPGETVAFVGPSGSGKSTLLNLVLGFLRPTSGHILLDGVDMESIDLRSFRSSVSVVPQESVLFEGTIRDNVTYGLDDVSDDRVIEALRDANALEIVDAMPEGWHTIVGERGARLSGGQRQRLAIARALVRDPRILLLDEATSALDAQSESQVREALARLMRDRTTLVVAHRLSTIRSADRIVVVDAGRIVEIGSHDELLAADGRYAALHRAQAL